MLIKASKRDYLWSFAAYFLKFGINLFVFPIVLNILNTAEYGLWVTFSSLTIIVNLFDFGFSSTLLRNVTYVWGGSKELRSEGYDHTQSTAKRDDRLFLLTIQTCKRIYLIIGAIAFIVTASFGTWYISYVVRDIYKPEYIFGWLIMVFGITLNLYTGYWSVLLRGVGAIKHSQKANIAGYLAQLILSYVGLLCGYGIIALAVATVVCGIVIRFISYHYFTHYQDICGILASKCEFAKQEIKSTFFTIWYNAKRAGVSSIATVLMTQSTTMLCSAYFGVEVTGEYGVCLQVLSALIAISQIFYQTTIPELTQLRQYDQRDMCKKRLSMSLCIAWGIFLGGTLICAFSGECLLNLIHSQTKFNLLIFLIVAYYSFGEMNYSMYASFISLGNRLPFVPSVVITSVITVALSFVSVYLHLGIWGLLLVRAITESAYIFWKWPGEVHQEMALNPWRIIKIGTAEIWAVLVRKIYKRRASI